MVAERRPFSGSQQAVAADIGTFAGLGMSELIFDFRSDSLAESLERMERFAPLIRPDPPPLIHPLPRGERVG